MVGPLEALELLQVGNRRFTDGRPSHRELGSFPEHGEVQTQEPFAIVIGCSDSRVPAELRGAYSVLKQAGVLPEEMELKKSIITLRSMLEAVADGDERVELEARLKDMSLRFDLLMERRKTGGAGFGRYRGAVTRRLFGR